MANSKNCESDERAGILAIENRTENWKTARYFSPFFGNRAFHLARRLEEGLTGKAKSTCKDEVHMELYWKGMRDFIQKAKYDREIQEPTLKLLKNHYYEKFSDLRQKVEEFDGCKKNKFRDLEDCNYRVEGENSERKLYDNLRNTEIDVVVETPEYLFIGEAKDESDFGANANLILVHQLIRQYVMATVLVKGCLGKCNKEIIPFVVGKRTKSLKKKAQVCFMKKHYNLKDENILNWEEIKGLDG